MAKPIKFVDKYQLIISIFGIGFVFFAFSQMLNKVITSYYYFTLNIILLIGTLMYFMYTIRYNTRTEDIKNLLKKKIRNHKKKKRTPVR